MSETASSTTKLARPAAKGGKRLFMRQANMLRVVYALIPVALCGVYFFGWRVAAVLSVSLAAGLGAEAITARGRKAAISMACLVTCILFALSLPPTIPLWIAAVGAVVGILFGKEVFGGFGRNFANPAIVGRAFVFLCFPNDMTNQFVPAFGGFPGGLARWSFAALDKLPEALAVSGRTVADAISQASPMWVAREYGLDAVRGAGYGASLWDMVLGTIGGKFLVPGETVPRVLSAGCIGEGCAAVILLAGVYLLWTRTANWRLMLGGLLGLVAGNVLFRTLLGYDGPGQVLPLEWQLTSGTAIFVVVFMITDPVSAPKKPPAQIAYGLLIGLLIVVLRWRGIFVAAATFAVLLGNLVGPLLDLGAGAWADRRKAPAAKGAAP